MADEERLARILLTDIRLSLRHNELRPVYAPEAVSSPVVTNQGQRRVPELATARGRDNLAQAILLRLLTPRGELAALAHPEYGSRLHELIGRENTETTRNLVRLYLLEALAQERRVARVAEVRVGPSPGRRDSVDVLLRVTPIGLDDTPLEVGPFILEL